MAGILKAVLESLMTIVVVVTILFVALRIVPGDPVEVLLGEYYTPELYAEIRAQLGLDLPIHVQYVRYAAQLVTGDWGRSIRTGVPVLVEISRVYTNTFLLAWSALVVALVVGLPLGLVAGERAGTNVDGALSVFAVSALAVPSFVAGIILIFVFSIHLGWFPMMGSGHAGGWSDRLWHLVLPCLSLGLRTAGEVARVARAEMADIRSSDYVRTARSKGISPLAVLFKHAGKNTLIPVITLGGLVLTNLLAGAAVTEVVFSRPGLGRLLVSSIANRDFPLILGTVIIFALTIIVVNLVLDVVYRLLDPRIREPSSV